MGENKENTKVSWLSSIKLKIMSMPIVATITVVIVICAVFTGSIQSHLESVNQNYLYDLAESYAAQVQGLMDAVGFEAATDYQSMSDILGDVGLRGVSSSYAYLVSADGTMLYHPTKEKVGNPVENAVVSGLVAQLQSGVIPKNGITNYDFKGVAKYAAYALETNGQWILVITADKSDIMRPINEIVSRGLVAAVILVIIFSALGIVLSNMIAKPIKKVTEIVGQLADLNFTEVDGQNILDARKDEMGVMGRAVGKLREQLAKVVTDLQAQSAKLFDASDSLNTNANETATTVEQVEKAVADIADGATSQASETQKASENVILMGNMVEETTEEVAVLLENANEMKKASREANTTLSELEKINEQARNAIDVIYEQTNTTNESAKKIREVTALITSIAEETNLLSLNASIEAARAGEQGRGFVVVASQIQKLAEQSNKSASQIEAIIDSLIADSDTAVETMVEVKEIMGNQSRNVEKTSNIFGQVDTMIATSIEGVNSISDKTKSLDEARVNVVDVVQNLTAIAEENAASTQETSASVTEVSSIVYDISENANQLKQIADVLDKNMKVFKM